jgi:translocation and assembly module TamB
MHATRSVILQVSGKSAEVLNWPEYRAWASPDITVVGDASGWKIGGKLLLPRADIEIREIPVEAIRVSEDAVVLGDEPADHSRTRIEAATRITLGEKVRVKALGLDTGLSGELLVRLLPDRDTTAEGKIQLVNGSFSTQGQKLAIQKGELTFTGPLDNPIVDVRAVRVIDTFEGTVTAGIHLYGRAQNLTSTVFSEPAMNQVDALSYLVLGRPLNQATESEGGELSGAAVSLGLRQATVLTEQIGQSLGLDQLSLSGDGGDTTALIAGKKINSRLYARYAFGVFSRIGTLLLRYRLSSRLTLEAGAGEQQSVDILYSVEKE